MLVVVYSAGFKLNTSQNDCTERHARRERSDVAISGNAYPRRMLLNPSWYVAVPPIKGQLLLVQRLSHSNVKDV